MPERLSGLSRRLAEVEHRLADKVRRENLANCVCREITVASAAREFEAEMNLYCPAHGLRRLGQIVHVLFINLDRTETEESAKLTQLVEAYQVRISQNSSSGIGLQK